MPRRKKEQEVEPKMESNVEAQADAAAIDMKELARAAYTGYATAKGQQASPFDTQMPMTQAAWAAAVVAVLEVLKLWTSEAIDSSPSAQSSELLTPNSSDNSEVGVEAGEQLISSAGQDLSEVETGDV